MNNGVKRIGKSFDKRVKDFLLLAILAIILLVFAWRIFQREESKETFSAVHTETELRVIRLLQELDGVGEVDVIVHETKSGVENVVIVCQGARDFNVIINVREAVSAALGTDEKSIKIYLKKE